MAIVFRSLQSNSVVDTTVTITAPTGIVVGDLLRAILAINSVSGVISPPAGWSTENSYSGTSNSIYVFYKVAVSADTTATDYTFTRTGGTSSFGGSVQRFTGVSTTSPLQTSNSVYTLNVGASPVTIANTVTPSSLDSMLMVTFFSESNAFTSEVVNITCATSNPTWNNLDNTYGRYRGYYAIRPETTATGNMTTSTWPVGGGTPGNTFLSIYTPKTPTSTSKIFRQSNSSKYKNNRNSPVSIIPSNSFVKKVIGGISQLIANEFWTPTVYQAPPTVALNTPADAGTTTDTTPTLNFTGTDPQSDDVEYEIQIDTVNTFDSQVALIDSYSETFINSYYQVYVGSITRIGQSFVNNNRNTLSSCSFYLSKYTGLPTGNGYAELYAVNNLSGQSTIPSNPALATSDVIDISTIPVGNTLISFTFSGVNKIMLEEGTTYFISFKSENGDVSNLLRIGGNGASGATFRGNAAYSSSTSWTAAPWDAIYYVYGNAPLLYKKSDIDVGFTSEHPFTSGVAKEYTVQSALALGTYYWRTRSIDPLGSNRYGKWSDTRSFTVTSSGVTVNSGFFNFM